MCVIIIKPRGKRIPPKSILLKAWESNSHGAGYAITHKGEKTTRVQKGFLDFEAFYKALLEENVSKKDILLMHFRIKTHGHISAEHTQPFPISTSKADLEKLAYKTNMICAHNGIFSLQGQPNDISDTMYYVQEWLTKLDLTSASKEGSPVKKEIEDDCTYNKIVLIVNGSVHLFGKWEKYQGCHYSNLGPIPYTQRATTSVAGFRTNHSPGPWGHCPSVRGKRRDILSAVYGGWDGDFVDY
jgi:hypothetical protein